MNDLGIPIAKVPLSAEQSKFFKTVYQNPERMTNKLLEKE
jgi:hypothetical protein